MYHDRYSETFKEQKESPTFRSLAETVENKCNLIRQAPYTACKSHPLQYEWTRKRSGRINKQYRVVYKICKECRKRDEGERNHMVECLSCDDTPDETVNFLAITDYH